LTVNPGLGAVFWDVDWVCPTCGGHVHFIAPVLDVDALIEGRAAWPAEFAVVELRPGLFEVEQVGAWHSRPERHECHAGGGPDPTAVRPVDPPPPLTPSAERELGDD
jgi:hypothetical protein